MHQAAGCAGCALPADVSAKRPLAGSVFKDLAVSRLARTLSVGKSIGAGTVPATNGARRPKFL